MYFDKIKSNAKINLALNITGKSNNLHKIETIVAFIDLYDQILIKKINTKKNFIKFCGKFSKNIQSNNTISKLFKILEQKRLIKQKYYIKINKNIPQKAGLGGGSMNAANILKYLIKKKVIFINKREMFNIARLIGSDVILGLQNNNTILTSNNKIQSFKNCKKFYILIIKPNFGCSTKKIYSHVNKFDKIRFNKPSKKMFNANFLKKMDNALERVVFNKYSSLQKVKSYLSHLENPIFVRMTGSGSALVSYYYSKKQRDKAQKQFNKDYKKYWCIRSKTI